jgi:hypothetical protein
MREDEDKQDDCFEEWLSENITELYQEFCDGSAEFDSFCKEQYKSAQDELALQGDLSRNR